MNHTKYNMSEDFFYIINTSETLRTHHILKLQLADRLYDQLV